MSALTVCRRCGYVNQAEYSFCSKCGASKHPPAPAKEFAEAVYIHPEADLGPLLADILYCPDGKVDWRPSIKEFEDMCQSELTETQRQCFYRRWRLQFPGTQKCEKWVVLSQSRGASATATKSVVERAKSKLVVPLGILRQQANEADEI